MSESADDIERVFLASPWGDDDIDAVKMALLYILHMVLLGNDRRKKVSTDYLQLVDHLDEFNSYPWGVVVWQMTYDSMSQASERVCSGRKKVSTEVFWEDDRLPRRR